MIPSVDLAAQQDRLRRRIEADIACVLARGQCIVGPEVAELEENLAAYTGAAYCITCGNGTDALKIALMALEIRPGDEVITPGFSYIAVAAAALVLGVKVVYLEVVVDFALDRQEYIGRFEVLLSQRARHFASAVD